MEGYGYRRCYIEAASSSSWVLTSLNSVISVVAASSMVGLLDVAVAVVDTAVPVPTSS